MHPVLFDVGCLISEDCWAKSGQSGRYLLGRVASPEEIEGPCCPSPNSQHSHQPFSSWQMTMIRIAGRWVLKWMRARWVAHRVMSNLHWPWVRPGYELKRYQFDLTDSPPIKKTHLLTRLYFHISTSHVPRRNAAAGGVASPPQPESPDARGAGGGLLADGAAAGRGWG